MPESFRTFISLGVAEAVKEPICRLQNELCGQLPEDAFRWTRPEQIHLTLKFLGNVPAGQWEEMASALREVCNGFAPLGLRAEGVGYFPSRGLPRVIWVGVRDENEALSRLQRAVEKAVNGNIGSAEEERFTGHLTIGRAKSLRPEQGRLLIELAQQFSGKSFGEWQAVKLDLMRSELGPQGSRYICLADMPFCREVPH
jgi:2'-5' RNA ligase